MKLLTNLPKYDNIILKEKKSVPTAYALPSKKNIGKNAQQSKVAKLCAFYLMIRRNRMKRTILIFITLIILLCSFAGCNQNDEDSTKANSETTEYSYSSHTVSSGDKSINPIKELSYVKEYSMDGTPLFSENNIEKHSIIKDSEINLSDIPTIVADTEVSVTPHNLPVDSDRSWTGNPGVYTTEFKKYDEYHRPGWKGLHLLPSGTYIIVFFEDEDSRNTQNEGEKYSVTRYENIFKLIVPERKTTSIYYSLSFNEESYFASDFTPKEKYQGGERVEIKLQLVHDQYYIVCINGESIPMIGSDNVSVIYAFIMPNEDAKIEIKTASPNW